MFVFLYIFGARVEGRYLDVSLDLQDVLTVWRLTTHIWVVPHR